MWIVTRQDESGAMPELEGLAGPGRAGSAPELWRRLIWASGRGPSVNPWDAAGVFPKF